MSKKHTAGPTVTAPTGAAAVGDQQTDRFEAHILEMMNKDREVLAYWNGITPKIVRIPKEKIENALNAGFNCLEVMVKNAADPGSVTFTHSYTRRRLIVTKKPFPLSGNLEVTDLRAIAITDSLAANYDSITFVCRLNVLRRAPITTAYFYTLCKAEGNIFLYIDYFKGVIFNGSATKGVKVPSSS